MIQIHAFASRICFTHLLHPFACPPSFNDFPCAPFLHTSILFTHVPYTQLNHRFIFMWRSRAAVTYNIIIVSMMIIWFVSTNCNRNRLDGGVVPQAEERSSNHILFLNARDVHLCYDAGRLTNNKTLSCYQFGEYRGPHFSKYIFTPIF